MSIPTVGTWLSLVEHSLGVRGVASSNLAVPTITLFRNNHLSFALTLTPTASTPTVRGSLATITSS